MKTIIIDDLREGMISNQTICDVRGTILVAKGVSLTHSIIKRLRKFNIEVVSIKEDAESVSSCSVFTSIGKQTLADVKNITESIMDSKTIKVKDNIATIENVMYSALKRPFIQEFIESFSKNEPLYKHSLRTAILSTNMGLLNGYDFLNLEYLAMSAIVHDCGMGKEFKEDSSHPLLGFMKLRANLDIDMVIALVSLQHHEYFSGGGFPFSFSRTQLTDFACLLAVVDHYDCLIMKNKDPRKALFETIGHKNTLFDPHMVELFGATIDWSRLYKGS